MAQRKIGIGLSYINILLNAVLGFVYVPILLYYIGKNEYGLYQLVGSLIAYFSVMDFGMTAAVTRFYTKYKALNDRIGMENILAIAIYGFLGVTIICLIIGGVTYYYLDIIFVNSMSSNELIEVRHIFLLLLFNIVVSLSTMVFKSVINAYERFLFLKGLETIQLIVQPILVVFILQQYPTAMAVAIIQTFLNIVLILARVYYCFVKLKIRIQFHYWDKELFLNFKRLALSVFIVTLIDQVFWKTNQIILGVIQGTAAVAVYSIASLIYMNYMALSTSISGVYLPYVTELVAKRRPMREISNLFIQIGRWQYYLLALVATGFIIFGKQFIQMWAGDGFSDAYWITIIIILPFTIDLIQNLGITILQAMNQYGLRAKVYFVIGVINLLGAIPLALLYGGIGCAVATGITMLIGNGLIMSYLYDKYIGIDIKQFWSQIARISIVVFACLVIGFVLNTILVSESKVIFLLKIIGYMILYGLSVYLFAMNLDEKRKVFSVVNKIFKVEI